MPVGQVVAVEPRRAAASASAAVRDRPRGTPPAAARSRAPRRRAWRARRRAAGRARPGRAAAARPSRAPSASCGARCPRCPRPAGWPRRGRARRPGRRRRCGSALRTLLQTPARSSGSLDAAAAASTSASMVAVGDRRRPGVVVGVEHAPAGRRHVEAASRGSPAPGRWSVQRAVLARPPRGCVCGRSAGWSAGGVRRTTPAARSSASVSGPAVRSQLVGEARTGRRPRRAPSSRTGRASWRCRTGAASKWSTTPVEEHLVAQGGVELLEDARALGVGDAVEVLQRRRRRRRRRCRRPGGCSAAGRRPGPTGGARRRCRSRRRRTR